MPRFTGIKEKGGIVIMVIIVMPKGPHRARFAKGLTAGHSG
jgi:hypothetical protein